MLEGHEIQETLSHFLKNAWPVLKLFLIPIGGGIPSGVLLAKKLGLEWPFMALLYLVSDIILAFVFEPLMFLFIAISKRSPFLTQFRFAFKEAMKKSTSPFNHNAGPLTLILIAFGVDPMTGRAAAMARGHGPVMGWVFAISGDMIYFCVIMVSTLWLNNILGDGTWTTLIILTAMLGGPWLIRQIREKLQRRKSDRALKNESPKN